MRKTYTLGTLGRGGRPVNFAGGELFEEMDNGEFTSKISARKAAAELAAEFARSAEDGTSQIAIVVSSDDEGIGDLMTVATAKVGQKRVQWS